MRFQPVYLPEPLGDRGSQTFLRHYNLCPRSGFLYAKHRGAGLKTVEMQRGSALHLIVQRCIEAMIENGEVAIPPDIAKAIANEVLAEIAVPVEEHDYLREMTYRWSSETMIDPAGALPPETLFVLYVDGFEVRAKVDYAERREDGAVCYVPDWKSSRWAPSFEDVARKRPDGEWSAKNFQLILYALVLAFGVPVRVEECLTCEGAGDACDDRPATQGQRLVCRVCEGRGEVEVLEPFPLASRAARFDLEFVFPGIETSDGKMLRRPVSLTRAELDEYRESLIGLVKRVRESERTGDWPAVVSDEACSICPATAECPIPKELRDHRGTISTVEQAAEAAMVLDRLDAVHAAVRKEIKAFCKAQGISLMFGNKVWEFVPVERTRVDRDGLLLAAERAARYGEPFEKEQFIKVSRGTDFKTRDLTDEERQEGSSGG